MHDKTDAIIYIGKAVSLRKRVRQYFQPSHDEGIKKKQMVEHIARFEYIITDSELEALVLECNLIKEHTPKYNTMLRDDKTYPYIRVTMGEDFPRVLFSRQIKKDKSRYFGPYTSAESGRISEDDGTDGRAELCNRPGGEKRNAGGGEYQYWKYVWGTQWHFPAGTILGQCIGDRPDGDLRGQRQ